LLFYDCLNSSSLVRNCHFTCICWNSTLWEPAYNIFILRFRPKKQQFLVALPTP